MSAAMLRDRYRYFVARGAALVRHSGAGLRGPLIGAFLVALSLFAFLAAGYHLTYTLFFSQAPLDTIAADREGGEEEDFLYHGIAYFHGARLADGDAVRFRYVVPRRVAAKSGKEIEFFVRLAQYEEGEGEASPGRLVIGQGGERQAVELEPAELQRHRIDWNPAWGERNDLEISFEAGEGDDGQGVVFGANLKNVSFWPQIAAWLLVGALALAAGMRLRPSMSFVTVLVVGAPLLLMFYIHSGAFISNELFGEPLKVRGFGRALLDIARDGHLGETFYRGAGVIFVPLVTMLVEWQFDRVVVLGQEFVSVYPTWRYVMFAWTAVGLAVLLVALNRHLGRAVALVTGILVAIFVPYITDLYYPDADATLIPMMLMLAGLFIALCHRPRAPVSWGLVLAVGVVLMAMMTVKITPLVLLPILPLALLAQSVFVHRTWRDRTALAMLVIAFVAILAGNTIRTGFNHPERNVGIEGVEFQSHNFWSQLYWSIEMYDRGNSPHGPQFRDKRRIVIEKMLELEGAKYPHHSQRAQDEIFRPAVLNAFRERPGHFYSYYFMRAYNEGIRFYKYSQSRPYLKDKGVNFGVKETNFGEFWKFAPTALLIQAIQNDMPREMDVVLLFFGLVGIALYSRADVMLFLYGCAAASYSHSILFHALTRYFNFMNFSLIIGLALFIVSIVHVIRRSENNKEFS